MRAAVLSVSAVLTLALVLCAPAPAQDGGGDDFKPGSDENLPWVSYDEALNQAKTRYRPVMLYFYGDAGRDLCKLAETKMFRNASAKSRAKRFSPVKISSSDEEMTRKYKVPPGRFAIVLLNFQLKELGRVTSEKELRKLSTALKNAYKENSAQSKKLKVIKKWYDKAMKYKRARRIRECIKILEEIAKLKGKVDSPYIDQAQDYLKELEGKGSKLLLEAEQAIQQAEQSLLDARRSGSSRYFREEYVQRARSQLLVVARDYPVQSLARRITSAQSRLASLTAEYQRMVQEEQGGDQDPQGQQGQQKGKKK